VVLFDLEDEEKQHTYSSFTERDLPLPLVFLSTRQGEAIRVTNKLRITTGFIVSETAAALCADAILSTFESSPIGWNVSAGKDQKALFFFFSFVELQ
jgi:hypothetical protein